jgi:hypothetical protein
VRQTFTDGRAGDGNWLWEKQTLAKYDSAGLFFNAFLERLFAG